MFTSFLVVVPGYLCVVVGHPPINGRAGGGGLADLGFRSVRTVCLLLLLRRLRPYPGGGMAWQCLVSIQFD